MSKYYYKKQTHNAKKILRLFSLCMSAIGVFVGLYIFSPILSWQFYFAPVFASQGIAVPIPKTTVVNANTFQSLIENKAQQLAGVDYTNASNWFPAFKTGTNTSPIERYSLSIPKIGIKEATVSTVDTLLSEHLVNYPGTGVPPDNGNAVVFGHSTLPQLYNQKDYKTIFANLYKTSVGDDIFVKVGEITYAFKIFSITIVEANDTSPLQQQYDNTYLTLITCTPPGTTWKRLIVKARLQKPE